MPKKLHPFHYSNIQKHHYGENKTTRKVIIQNGKGYKSVSYYKKGKCVKTIKRPLTNNHISMIKDKKFIPGLFSDCRLRKTRKQRNK
jgi:hypothetical protein